MTTTSTGVARRLVPAWVAVVVGALTATGWTAALLWLALPRYDVCPAIHPAPPGCSDRTDLAWPWIAATWAAVALLLATTRVRRGRGAWLAAALGLVLAVGAVGHRTVLYAITTIGTTP